MCASYLQSALLSTQVFQDSTKHNMNTAFKEDRYFGLMFAMV